MRFQRCAQATGEVAGIAHHPEIAARERSLLAEFVFVERAGKGVPVERLLRFALRKYDARTGEDIELLPGPVAPFGTPRRFDRHHKGRAYEVPD